MELVVVIGAGAPLAEAQSHRPQQTRFHPPLDTSFFSKAVEISGSLVPTLRRAAISAGMPDPFANPEPRMEEFFGDVYYDVQDSNNTAALNVYRVLLRTYMQTLTRTTDWFHDRSSGALRRWFRDLLALQDLERITILSFNHDLVIENVLMRLPRPLRWCVDLGYGPIALVPVASRGTTRLLPRHDPLVCDHSIPIDLLKLHGSLNWQVMTRAHDPSYHDLFPSTAHVQSLECIIDQVPKVGLHRKRGQRLWNLWPQIVPPIYGKQSIISNRFGSLWERAAESLRNADRVVFFGYSLPSADIHTEKMISRSMANNSTCMTVEVINPDPGAAHRFAQVTNTDHLLWYRDISHFQP